MATWVTHLMIADGVLKQYPYLDRRGFCVGNIAPDCNIENEDWTEFTPPRSVTHWMTGTRKNLSDCDGFYRAYIRDRVDEFQTAEEYSFLLGYYVHLIADAAFQAFIRDNDRVKAAWRRLKSDDVLRVKSEGMVESWDSIKKLIPKSVWMRNTYGFEAEYLHEHPNSGYLTEIIPLQSFPDYIDYLPSNAIARKISVMGYIPQEERNSTEAIAISRDEFFSYVESATRLAISQLSKWGVVMNLSGELS